MDPIRTDLAMEAHERYREQNGDCAPGGVTVQTQEHNGMTVTRVHVRNEEGERQIGKPKGRYVTVESRGMVSGDPDRCEDAARQIARELKALLPKSKKRVLVAGLGNRGITPDALGPKTVDGLFVTRHLKEMLREYGAMTEVSAIAPGVLGITGVETAETVRGILGIVRPDCLIAVDALASRSVGRLHTTVQLTDGGICPGSGIGNDRSALDRKGLGIPVIGVGIPTVVDAATVAADSLELLLGALARQGGEETARLGRLFRDPHDAFCEVLSGENMIVAPKDSDVLIDRAAQVLSSALNLALHPQFSYREQLELKN